MNWSTSYKWLLALMFDTTTFCDTFASGMFDLAVKVTAELYGVSSEVTILGVSLFVLVRHNNPCHQIILTINGALEFALSFRDFSPSCTGGSTLSSLPAPSSVFSKYRLL